MTPIKIAFFNHKGGVGKTTLASNVARALENAGHRVLLVDADPQCNLTALHLDEKSLDELLDDSNEEVGGNTIWSALRPVVRGKGDIADVVAYGEEDEPAVVAGDVLLSDYERELYKEWSGCFTGDERSYDVISALSRATTELANKYECSLVIYDIGPNIGALNRVILLDSDYFIVPLAPDLFSLRALSTVGRTLSLWIEEWKTAKPAVRKLLKGTPKFLGYVTSSFKITSAERSKKANPHEHWENRIGVRVKSKIVEPLAAASSACVLAVPQKLGEIQNYQSLASKAMQHRRGIGELKNFVNSGHQSQVKKAGTDFDRIAGEIAHRIGL